MRSTKVLETAICMMAMIMLVFAPAGAYQFKISDLVDPTEQANYKFMLGTALIQADNQGLGVRTSQGIEGGYLVAEYANRTAGDQVVMINLTSIQVTNTNLTLTKDDWRWVESETNEHFGRG